MVSFFFFFFFEKDKIGISRTNVPWIYLGFSIWVSQFTMNSLYRVICTELVSVGTFEIVSDVADDASLHGKSH